MTLVVALGLVGLGCAARKTPQEPVAQIPAPATVDGAATNADLIAGFRARGFETTERDEGVVVYLPDVYFFKFDSSDVAPNARDKIRDIATFLNRPGAATRQIALEGHADAIGSQTYNQTLSERRARAVMDELAAGGLARERISAAGFGEQRPIAPNRRADGSDDPDGRAKNRRVELIVKNPS
jgi:outer membrane protein OmpA-like peptidoglycan-associated protein